MFEGHSNNEPGEPPTPGEAGSKIFEKKVI